MSHGVRVWLALVIVNLTLPAAAALLAPGSASVSHTTDRAGYEFVAEHPLAAGCPHAIYCYRVLVPMALQAVPGESLIRWRGFAVLANALAGVVIAAATMRSWPADRPNNAPPRSVSGLVASLLFQTSFGATFALFDPYTPDPAVFVCAALLAYAWLADRPWLAASVGLVGVWAKETVALIALAVGIGALVVERSSGWSRRLAWLAAGVVPGLVIVSFHLAANRLLGWSEAASGSADVANGAWLGRWLADGTLTPASRVFYLFIPFAFGWLYAAAGVASAQPRLRALASGAVLTLPLLVYVQTPERALGNAFFVVVPLAAIFLARAPWPLAVAAAATNGLLTARVGLATNALLPAPYWFALAAALAAATLVWVVVSRRLSAAPASGGSRPLISSR